MKKYSSPVLVYRGKLSDLTAQVPPYITFQPGAERSQMKKYISPVLVCKGNLRDLTAAVRPYFPVQESRGEPGRQAHSGSQVCRPGSPGWKEA